MKHMMKYLATPSALAIAFLMFATPSAPLADSVLPDSGTVFAAESPTVAEDSTRRPTSDCGYMVCFPLPADSDGDGLYDIFDPCPFDPSNSCQFNNDITPGGCDDYLGTAVGVFVLGLSLAGLGAPPVAILGAAIGGAGLLMSCMTG